MRMLCRNKDCERYGQADYYPSTTYRYRDGRLVSDDAACPVCGREREELNDNEDIPLSEKTVDIGRYTNASPEQRREILKRRSHEHFLREVRPRKEHMLEEARRAMQESGE